MTIISHQLRCIFVRTRKTGSTSLEIELSRHAGPGDVITSFCGRDEELRRLAGGLGPQNHLEPGVEPGASPVPPGPLPGVRYYNHMSAAQVRELVGRRTWDEYFTFCVERNPWDKAVSLYYHRHRSEPRQSFADFVAGGEVADALNFPLYHDGRHQLVDHIIRYEDLLTEVAEVFHRLGLPGPTGLPHAKNQFRKSDGSSVVDTRSASMIADIFREEINLFGYRPPSWTHRPA